MDIVIDSSAIIAVIANEPEKQMLIAKTAGHDLIAPPSIHWEIGNAFSAMLKRQRIELSQTLQALEIYEQIPLRFVTIHLRNALQLADQFKIYAYDAYLLQCAIQYRAPLLTLDKALQNHARTLQIQLLQEIQ